MHPFSSLQNYFTDYSCIVVSSAPSLDRYIDLIKAYENKFIIICVDSAYSALESNKITPDFIVSIDPQPWTEEHLLSIDKKIPLITGLSSWHNNALSEKSFIFMNSHPFSQLLAHYYPEIGDSDSKTGTVAGDAIFSAFLMGFKNIYLTGIDFSFPKHLIYSKDSTYNNRYTHFINDRLSSTESLHMKYIRKSPTKLVENHVLTRQSFLQFRDSFERFLRELEINNMYLLQDAGLSINGMKLISEKSEVSSLFEKETVINSKKVIVNNIVNNSKQLSTLFSVKDLKKLYLDNDIIHEMIAESSTQVFAENNINKMKSLILKSFGNMK